ncbi:MAG TPA: carboxypeptidase-like regulatory domain-containing protein, partial [Pyrinomonadaceae bacterium]
MNKSRIRGVALASFLVSILLATTAYAQSGSSTVQGTVKDPQGNLVSGATVTLTDPAKNFSRTQQTNADGAYVFTAIPPGTYKLEVTAPGFKTASASGLVALVDTPTVRDVQLEIGAVSETVDVTSAAEAAINTSDASLGNSFERKRITELPLNANNVVGLLSLQPGVTRSGSVNGARSDQSNITLDGVDVNEQQDGLDIITDEAFASVLRVTRDSLQEFRV